MQRPSRGGKPQQPGRRGSLRSDGSSRYCQRRPGDSGPGRRESEAGSTIEAGPDTVVGLRDRETREVRWEKPDEDITYGAKELDRFLQRFVLGMTPSFFHDLVLAREATLNNETRSAIRRLIPDPQYLADKPDRP